MESLPLPMDIINKIQLYVSTPTSDIVRKNNFLHKRVLMDLGIIQQMTKKRYYIIKFRDEDNEKWMVSYWQTKRNEKKSEDELIWEFIKLLKECGDYGQHLTYVLPKSCDQWYQSFFECSVDFNILKKTGECPLGGWGSGYDCIASEVRNKRCFFQSSTIQWPASTHWSS
tara:strand:- start:62 stop:571 length:510 start_codon:yes stop_codon:yes gene_type:complete